MLGTWEIVMTQMGCSLKVSVVWGCKQGWVLSPLLWSLVVDRLLHGSVKRVL